MIYPEAVYEPRKLMTSLMEDPDTYSNWFPLKRKRFPNKVGKVTTQWMGRHLPFSKILSRMMGEREYVNKRVCVCVCVRERESVWINVCVCVSERERERVREREGEVVIVEWMLIFELQEQSIGPRTNERRNE